MLGGSDPEKNGSPGETPQKYLYELKGLLRKAFPEMSTEAKEQLIFEQYIRGFPKKSMKTYGYPQILGRLIKQ